MKQLLAIGCAAVLLGLACSSPAQAWCNAKFSVGLNWSVQSGNNSLLWGVYRNGQIPENMDGYGGGPPPGYGHGQPFPWFGSAQTQQSMPQATAAYPQGQPPPYASNYNYGNQSSNFYQASYQQPSNPPYQYASYPPSYYSAGYYNYNANNYTPNFTDPYAWYYGR